MKKNHENYYEMRKEGATWGTGYYAYSVHSAIRKFLNDTLYHFDDGVYSIEVRNYPTKFVVTKKTKVITKTTVNIKKSK